MAIHITKHISCPECFEIYPRTTSVTRRQNYCPSCGTDIKQRSTAFTKKGSNKWFSMMVVSIIILIIATVIVIAKTYLYSSHQIIQISLINIFGLFNSFWSWILIIIFAVVATCAHFIHFMLITIATNTKLASNVLMDGSTAIQSASHISGTLSRNLIASCVAKDVTIQLSKTKRDLHNLALSLNSSGLQLKAILRQCYKKAETCHLIAKIVTNITGLWCIAAVLSGAMCYVSNDARALEM